MADLSENNEKNDDLKIEDTKGGPGERVRKMKQRLEKMVLAMKQPDEEEIDEDMELANPFSFGKKDEKEKQEETNEFAIKDIFADESEKKPEAAAEIIEKTTEDRQETAGESDSETGTEQEIPEKVVQIQIPPAGKKKDVPRITEIKPSSAEKNKKNLSEGDIFQLIYHGEEKDPFIVIAGKFTRTLRGEYEAVRQSRQAAKDVKTDEKIVKIPQKMPEQVKEIQEKPSQPANVAAIIKKVEPVGNEPKTDVTDKKKAKKKWNERFIFKNFGETVYYEPVSGKEVTAKELDDYTAQRDAEDVKTEIEKNLHTVAVRTSVLFVTAVFSLTAAAIMQYTPLFSETMRTGWLFYAIICFALFTIAVAVARLPIVNGLMPLRYFRGNSDTAAAVTALAADIQSVTALCTPHVFTDGTYHIYVPIAIIALFCNSVGKLMIITRTLDNFKYLSGKDQKYAGKIYTDTKNAEKMVSEFPSKSAIIAYMKRSEFMSNFLRLSYAPDPSEKLAAKIAPPMAVTALVMGILYGIISLDFAGGVTSFALTACVGTPVMCLIVLNIPMKQLCRTALENDAMISGYEAVQQFRDTNAVMIDASQLYGDGTVTMKGMKVFQRAKIDDALQAGAAVMYAVNGTMTGIFENIMHCSRESLPKVDSVVYEDEQGLLAWVNKQRVLIGNRKLLETHNIKVPRKELEDKYKKGGGEVAYISVNGELVVMFMLSYRTDRGIARELSELQANGVSFLIRTIDPNITKEKVAEKFGLFHRCVTILPTGLGNICNDVMGTVDEQSRAYLVTGGKLTSFAAAISGCIKMRSSVVVASLFQYASIIFGILVFSAIAFLSGFQKLGSLEVLVYITFWALATITTSLIKIK